MHFRLSQAVVLALAACACLTTARPISGSEFKSTGIHRRADSDPPSRSPTPPSLEQSNVNRLIEASRKQQAELRQNSKDYNARKPAGTKPVPNLQSSGYGVGTDPKERTPGTTFDPARPNSPSAARLDHNVYNTPAKNPDDAISKTSVYPESGTLMNTYSMNKDKDTRRPAGTSGPGPAKVPLSGMHAAAYQDAVPPGRQPPKLQTVFHNEIESHTTTGSDGVTRNTVDAIKHVANAKGADSNSNSPISLHEKSNSPTDRNLRDLVLGQTHGRETMYKLKDHPQTFGGGRVVGDVRIHPGAGGFGDDPTLEFKTRTPTPSPPGSPVEPAKPVAAPGGGKKRPPSSSGGGGKFGVSKIPKIGRP